MAQPAGQDPLVNQAPARPGRQQQQGGFGQSISPAATSHQAPPHGGSLDSPSYPPPPSYDAGNQEVKIDDLGSILARDVYNRRNNSYLKAVPGHIPRITPIIRNINSAAYDPQIISIGPYHHGNPDLQNMEDHKNRYILEFLTSMPGNSSITTEDLDMEEKLDSLINPVRMSEEKLLSLYSLEPNKETSSDDFIKMIILDGCFILRFLIKMHVRSEREGDPIFSEYTNLLPLLQRDLLLLENQLPFFILEKLYELIPKPNSIQPFPTLKEVAFAYLTRKLSTDPVALNNLEAYHLLHLYDLILLPKARDQSILESNQNAPSIVPTATELREAGIKMSAKKADNFLEVSYVQGKLQIPCLQIKDVTIPIFHNLIAFEQCCPSTGNHFTAYIKFMNLMVNSTKDVEVLQESWIIENKLGSEDKVVNFFNQIEMSIDHQNHYLTPVFRDIDAYCTTRWHSYRAKFRRNYCSSPLMGILVFAAIVLLLLLLLLLLTLLRAIYIVKSY